MRHFHPVCSSTLLRLFGCQSRVRKRQKDASYDSALQEPPVSSIQKQPFPVYLNNAPFRESENVRLAHFLDVME